MKKNYEFTGMSCGGCAGNVKQALLKVPDLTEAEVQLHPQAAVVTMDKSIDVGDLQTQLSKAGHYTIKEVA